MAEVIQVGFLGYQQYMDFCVPKQKESGVVLMLREYGQINSTITWNSDMD